jgi:hypothetical protein
MEGCEESIHFLTIFLEGSQLKRINCRKRIQVALHKDGTVTRPARISPVEQQDPHPTKGMLRRSMKRVLWSFLTGNSPQKYVQIASYVQMLLFGSSLRELEA